MAVFAFIIGGVFGLMAGVLAWLGFGLSIPAAFGIYLGLSLGVGLALILFAMTGAEPTTHTARA